MPITLTYVICMAAGRDAGNAHMRKAGRTIWNLDDRNAAAREANRLLDIMGIV